MRDWVKWWSACLPNISERAVWHRPAVSQSERLISFSPCCTNLAWLSKTKKRESENRGGVLKVQASHWKDQGRGCTWLIPTEYDIWCVEQFHKNVPVGMCSSENSLSTNLMSTLVLPTAPSLPMWGCKRISTILVLTRPTNLPYADKFDHLVGFIFGHAAKIWRL